MMGAKRMTDERQTSSHFTLPLGGSRRRDDDEGRAPTFSVRSSLTSAAPLPSPEARPSQRESEADEPAERLPSNRCLSPLLPATLVFGDDNWLSPAIAIAAMLDVGDVHIIRSTGAPEPTVIESDSTTPDGDATGTAGDGSAAGP